MFGLSTDSSADVSSVSPPSERMSRLSYLVTVGALQLYNFRKTRAFVKGFEEHY